MAKHRKRSRNSAVMVAGATAGISTALTLGHATNATAATLPQGETVIGVGGWRNPTSDRVKNKFEGAYDVAGFKGVNYPAALPIDPSVDDGVPALSQEVDDASGHTVIVGYSEGSIVAERYKRSLAGQPTKDIEFVYIAAPTVPNGGIYARFPDLRMPGFTSTGAAAESPYKETFVTIEYDPVGDFPAYANPLSLANAAAGMVYLHGDPTPDATNLETADKAVYTSDDGDTYILVKTEHLPLLRPVRDVSAALNTTALTEPVLGAIEPTLKLGVDMGYTDRDYSNADTPTRFSLVTPPERVVETVKQLPGAIKQGTDNLTGGSPSTSEPETSAKQAETSKPEQKPDKPSVAKPKTRKPAERGNNLTDAVSRTLKNLKPKKPAQKDDAPAEKQDADSTV